MTTAVLTISCLLSAAFGVGAAVLTSLARRSLEVRSADLARLQQRVQHLTERNVVAETAANEALNELKLVRADIRNHELDISALALKAGLRRAA